MWAIETIITSLYLVHYQSHGQIVPRRNSTPSFLHWRTKSTPLFCTCVQIVPHQFEHADKLVPRYLVHADKEYPVDLSSIHDVMIGFVLHVTTDFYYIRSYAYTHCTYIGSRDEGV